MPLPSQSSRTTRHGRHVYRRKTYRRRTPLTIVGLGGLVALAWLFWPDAQPPGTPGLAQPDAGGMTSTQGGSDVQESTDRASDHLAEVDSQPLAGSSATAAATPVAAPTIHHAFLTMPAGVIEAADPAPQRLVVTKPAAATPRVVSIDTSRAATTPLLAPLAATTTMTAADLLGSTPPLAMPQPVLSAAIAADLDRGTTLLAERDPVAARAVFSKALASGQLDLETSSQVRSLLSSVNDRLVFGREVAHDDPYVLSYKVQPGDSLSRIASRNGLKTNWRLIQRINGISRPDRLRVGQTIKLVKGPFHAEVDKSGYRLDLYLGQGQSQVFVRSFSVGLGAFDSTPTGVFRVRPGSKLINPPWTNPRTGEYFEPDDPRNPIGEHWLGLEGIEARTKDLHGNGIHGTIEPSSIGACESMGCVRLLDDDVALLYETLTEGNSTVAIRE